MIGEYFVERKSNRNLPDDKKKFVKWFFHILLESILRSSTLKFGCYYYKEKFNITFTKVNDCLKTKMKFFFHIKKIGLTVDSVSLL